MVSWFSTKMPKQFNGEGIVFSTNGAGTIGYWHAVKDINGHVSDGCIYLQYLE